MISEEKIAKSSSILENLKVVYREKVMAELNKLEQENQRLEEQFHKEENTRKKIRELIVREVGQFKIEFVKGRIGSHKI